MNPGIQSQYSGLVKALSCRGRIRGVKEAVSHGFSFEGVFDKVTLPV